MMNWWIFKHSFRDDHERGEVSRFKVALPENFGTVKMIRLYRDSHFLWGAWFLDKIEVSVSK